MSCARSVIGANEGQSWDQQKLGEKVIQHWGKT